MLLINLNKNKAKRLKIFLIKLVIKKDLDLQGLFFSFDLLVFSSYIGQMEVMPFVELF
jgi:hypothetical protein